jgi:hypothetical protein
MSEFVPGYEAGSWFGSARYTPSGIVVSLNVVVNDGLADQAVRAHFRGHCQSK